MANDAVVLLMRPLYAQDFATATSFATTTDTILNVGAGITVTPMVLAANDTAAAAAGVPVGGIYVNNGGAFIYLKTRMT